jgi:uncharacterized repeat protein (TIGR02543 family)
MESNMKILKRSVILIVILSLLLSAGTVFAIPPTAETYWGTATLDGSPADGVSVTAEMNGRGVGSDTASSGTYSLVIQTQEGDQAGDDIDFFIDGNPAGSSTLDPGAITEKNLSATSPIPQKTLTISTNPSNAGNPSGAGDHDEGDTINIRANPKDCYEFVNWTGDTVDIANVNDPTTTITMNDDYDITANYSPLPEYTLEIIIIGDGTVSGDGTYCEDEQVAITAIPNEGWEFVSWTGDVADPNSASTTVTMDENKTVTANFNQIGVISYNLTISINGQGTTSPSAGIYPYAEGTVVDVSANPSNGWVFVNWSGDTGTIDDINDPDITITMDNNYTITANFSELPQYTLTIDVDGEGTTSGAGTYYEGEEVSIRANPASDWTFAFWSGGSTTIGDVNDSTTTIIMNDDYTITANFVEVELFTLTILVNGNGSTNPTIGDHEYQEGTVVNISAIPDQDWQFASWSGDVANPNSSSTTITMDANKSITANFNPFGITTHLLTISINGQGTTSPSDGDHSYQRGKVVTITAIPGAGWSFDSWSGDTSLLSNVTSPTTTITMNDDAEITANFTKEDDITAPVIPVVLAANITKTSADIFWITDEPSDSQVDYWASPGELTPLDTTLVTEHLVRLSNLEPATTYHYKVMSKDENGNLKVSDEYTFVTTGTSANFAISDWETSVEDIDDGKTVAISFLVTNTGDVGGSYQANLSINGEVEETRDITLAAAASQEVLFTINLDATGTYTVTVDEHTLSFAFEPEGGINWFLIIAINLGVLFIITICIYYVVRRTKSKDDEIPRLRITEKETFEDIDEEDFGKGIEDVSDGTLVTHFGLTITTMARMKLKEALLSKTKDPNKSFRITMASDKPGQLKMILDNEKVGDQVITSDGTKILFISQDVIPHLEGMIIDYQVTPEGSGFNISTLSKD